MIGHSITKTSTKGFKRLNTLHPNMKIFFATAADLSILGAPRSIDMPMVVELEKLGHDVHWFGINIPDEHDFKGKKTVMKRKFITKLYKRLRNKLLRLMMLESAEDQKLREQISFDKWMLKQLKHHRNSIDEKFILIGRGVSSVSSFEFVKENGGKCILHSQWTHPSKHKHILSDVFYRHKKSYQPIPEIRIQRQLREIKCADLIWCISNLVKKSYLDANIDENKIFLSTLGVDINYFKRMEKNKKTDEPLTILFVGNVNYEKGVHILFEALRLANLSNYNLILNGAVPEYFNDVVKKGIKDLTNQQCLVTIAPGDPLENYKKADILILPSLHESFGLVVIEAMACGLPVIITSEVGASDHVIDNKNGIVVNPDDAHALSEKIKYLSCNPGERKRLGDEAHRTASYLSWDRVTANLSKNISDKLLMLGK